MNKNLVAVIPVRKGSQRVKNKNFKFFAGKNLLIHKIQVLKQIKMATYEINMKRILKKEGTVVGLANGILSADGKIIYRAENLKVGLFKS